MWSFKEAATTMSSCSIARALFELQQVNAAGLAHLTNLTHPQIEQLCCGASPRPNPTGLVGVARKDLFYKSQFQKTSSFRFAFGLSAVGQVAHTPKSSGPKKERAACHGRDKGWASLQHHWPPLLLQEKAATNTDICADFSAKQNSLNPDHALQIPPQGLTALS